jgi:hypothetical protein
MGGTVLQIVEWALLAGGLGLGPVAQAQAQAQAQAESPHDLSFAAVTPETVGVNAISAWGYDWYLASARQPYSIGYAAKGDIWRFELRAGDNEAQRAADIAGAKGKDRSELWMLGNDARSFASGVCMRFRMYVQDMPREAGKWTVLGQWHAVEDAGDAHLSPVFAQEFNSDGFRIVIRSDFAATQALPNKNPTVVYADRAYPLGQWVDWQYQILFSKDQPNGALTAWRDGAVVAQLSGVGLGYNDRIAPRYQFGIYRGYDYAGAAVVYYSGMRFSQGACAGAK